MPPPSPLPPFPHTPAGSGKTTTLEGSRGIDTRGGAEGNGLVHLACDTLFELLQAKAVAVGGWRGQA
jgi:hypothetical protein